MKMRRALIRFLKCFQSMRSIVSSALRICYVSPFIFNGVKGKLNERSSFAKMGLYRVLSRTFAIVALFVFGIGNAYAHNSINSKIPNCAELLVAKERAPETLIHQREAVLKSIYQKIEDRTAIIHQSRGTKSVLVRDIPSKTGETTTDLRAGISRLFSRDIMVASTITGREAVKRLSAKWMERMRSFIESQHEESKHLRKQERQLPGQDQSGLFETPFIAKHRFDLLKELNEQEKLKPGSFAEFKSLVLNRQEAYLKNFLIQRTNADIHSLAAQHSESLVSDGRILADKITDDYASGVTAEPNFQALHDFIVKRFEAFKFDLARRFPMPKEFHNEDLERLMQIHGHPNDAVTFNKEGRLSISLPQGQGVAEYDEGIATLVLRLIPPRSEKEQRNRLINGVMLHGAGTNRSNVASWLNLLSLAGQSGVQAVAYDLPGSVGERGLGLNSVRKSDEMGVYLELLTKHAKDTAVDPQLPLVVMGRSMGSTIGLMTISAASRLGFKPRADLWFLMSFSNPLTLDLQTQNVYAQRDRGETKGIVEEALDHSTIMAEDLQAHLAPVQHPVKITEGDRRIQDTVVYVQGAGDEDGTVPGSAPGAVVKELYEYRDKYTPYIHVYEFPDPLEKYKVNGVLPGMNPQDLEAMHFLLSARGNTTDRSHTSLPADVPDKDLPKLRDQHFEVYALQYAMLDYQIDLSPLTSPKRREELRLKRYKATGMERPFSYLAWYVDAVINKNTPADQKRTLEKIIADESVLPNRDFGVEGRIKKIYEFCKSERERALNLLKK